MFSPTSGAVYLNICSDPNININARTGGCAEINVLNSNVTSNKDRTRMVMDRLHVGTSYKACLVSDNVRPEMPGRWVHCIDFVASNDKAIAFSLSSSKSVGQP